jgi:hypothetical protein
MHQGSLDRGLQDADAHSLGNAVEDSTVLVVTIANEQLGRMPERRRLPQLLRGPRLGRRACHRKVHDPSRVHVHDEEGKDRSKPHVVCLHEIASPRRVVAEEGQPRLTMMRPRRARAAHVLLHRALGDVDADLQQFAADSLRSPQRFSRAMRRMSSITSRATLDLALAGRFERNRQSSRNPSRCQRRIVSRAA